MARSAESRSFRREVDTTPSGDGHSIAWKVGTVFFVLSGAVLVLSHTRSDPDLWGHLLFGRLMLHLGEIPRIDPYSYLATEWINHEWLAEVIFAAVFGLIGPAGLVLLKVVVGLLLLTPIYFLLVREGLDALRAGTLAFLTLVLIAFGTPPVRPQLFTYLFFLVTLLVLREATKGTLLWLLILPPVMAAWTNFHGGFLAGIGIVLLWSLVRLAESWSFGERGTRLQTSATWLATLVGVGGATLVNPYGVELPLFLARTATVARPEIVEWNPVVIVSVEGAFYLLYLSLTAWALIGSRRRRSPAALAVLAVTALLPLQAVRHVPLFALSAGVLAAPHFASTFARTGESSERKVGGDRIDRAATVLMMAAGLFLLFASLPNFQCIRMNRQNTTIYPAAAVALVDRAGVEANLATYFDWGEYVIWQLGPEVQVSMDGRRETVYADSIYAEYRSFVLGVGDWDSLLEDQPTDLALVPPGFPVFNLLGLKPGWELLHADSLSALFGRTGARQTEAIRSVELPQAAAYQQRCFPSRYRSELLAGGETDPVS